MTPGFVIGYDPGGNRAHGVAILDVVSKHGRWLPIRIRVTRTLDVGSAHAWLNENCTNGPIVAVGVDTLTEWSTGESGWRRADRWLRATYPAVANSVVSPNSIYGSMAVNGAAFLVLLTERFRLDGTMITEAHPKVCYYALTGRKHAWADNRHCMVNWLEGEFALEFPADLPAVDDDCFDAGIAALAALRGLNGDWPLDLHTIEPPAGTVRVRFCGPTHFWWPAPR